MTNEPLEYFRSSGDGETGQVRQFAKDYVRNGAYLTAAIIGIFAVVVVGMGVYFLPTIAGAFLEQGYYPWELVVEDVFSMVSTGWLIAQFIWAFLLLVLMVTVIGNKGE